MFWFVFFGVQGLLVMALIEYIVRENVFQKHPAVQGAAEQCQGWMLWIPQRLMGFSFALVGHFSWVMKDLKETFWLSWQNSHDFSSKVGLAALYEDKSPLACQRLLTHSIWVWLGILGLVNLFSMY
jgi:membrane protein required for beta-lactamase induction